MKGLYSTNSHWASRSLLTVTLFTIVILMGLSSISASSGKQRSAQVNPEDTDTPSPLVVITSPLHGTFTPASNVTVTGHIVPSDLANAQVTLNGMSVTLNSDGTFATDIAVDHGIVINPILAELTIPDAPASFTARMIVIAGNAVKDDELAPESLGLRLNDSGFNRVEPLVKSQIDLDIASLLPPGAMFSDEVCDKIPPFGTKVCGEVQVSVSQTRPPRLGGFEVDLDSQVNAVTATLDLNDIFVSADVEASAGPLSVSCRIDVGAANVRVRGAYNLEPNTSNPATINVIQQGDATITIGNFNDNTDCGGLLGDVIEELVDLFIGEIQTRLRRQLADFLNKVDSTGNTPLARALESGLTQVSFERLINNLSADQGLVAATPLVRVAEDNAGVTLSANTRITSVIGIEPGQCDAPPDTPRNFRSYRVPATFPAFGAATPAPSNLPYDIGITLSATSLNQLLKAIVECGLLQKNFTEVDVGFGLTPITPGLLSLFIPAFQSLENDLPLSVRLRPTLAPFITANPGPAGELMELAVSHFLVEIIDSSKSSLLLQVALDVRAGLNLNLDTENKALQLSIGEVVDPSLEILDNAVGADSASLRVMLEQLLPIFSDLAEELTLFTFPTIFNIPLEGLELSRLDGYLVLYTKLALAP